MHRWQRSPISRRSARRSSWLEQKMSDRSSQEPSPSPRNMRTHRARAPIRNTPRRVNLLGGDLCVQTFEPATLAASTQEPSSMALHRRRTQTRYAAPERSQSRSPRPAAVICLRRATSSRPCRRRHRPHRRRKALQTEKSKFDVVGPDTVNAQAA